MQFVSFAAFRIFMFNASVKLKQEKNMNNRKRFGSMTVYEETLFFISCNDVFPGLYRVDLSDKGIECLGEVPWENYHDENALLEKIEDMIVIAPRWHKNKFLLYDLKARAFQPIFLEQNVWFGDTSVSAFSNVVKARGSLFFVGNKNGLIVEYCSKKNSFCLHNLTLPKELCKEDLNFFWNSVSIEKNILYLPIRKGGLLSLSLDDFHVNYIKFEEGYECFSMSRIGNILWLLPYCGNNVMIFDLNNQTYKYIELPIEEKNIPFITAINSGTEVLLIPMFAGDIIAVNKRNYGVSKKGKLGVNDLKKEQNKRQFLSIYRDVDGTSYLQKNGSFKLWIFGENGKFIEKSILVQFEDIQDILKSTYVFKRKFFIENMDIELQFMTRYLKNCQQKRNLVREKFGVKIWELLK